MGFIRDYIRLCHEFCTTDIPTRAAIQEHILPRLEQELEIAQRSSKDLERIGDQHLLSMMRGFESELEAAVAVGWDRLGVANGQMTLF